VHSSVSRNASNRRVEIDGKHKAQGEEKTSRENERDRMNHGAKRESAGKGASGFFSCSIVASGTVPFSSALQDRQVMRPIMNPRSHVPRSSYYR
jgi:hypothetical protein